ncbi:hypothetical protein K474DRAFT_1674417, partial [Panus rudis PR-1116 ss-1]
HRVLVLEEVGPSLQEYSQYKHMRPFCDRHMREIARQLVLGLKALHELGYAHLNIQPSSVFFRSGETSKLSQLSSNSQFVPRYLLRSAQLVISGLHHATIVNGHLQSGAYGSGISIYEAPELTMSCLLVELVQDGPLFYHTDDALERLGKIRRVIGEFPSHILAGEPPLEAYTKALLEHNFISDNSDQDDTFRALATVYNERLSGLSMVQVCVWLVAAELED